MPRPGLLRPVRVAYESPGGRHKILAALLELPLRLLRSPYDIRGDDRYAYGLLYRLCQVFSPARLICGRLEPAVICIVIGARHVDGVDTEFLESLRDLLSGLKAVALARLSDTLHHLVDREAHDQRVILSATLLYASYYLFEEPHAVLKAAAVLILSVVGIRREELLYQVAVSSVEFHRIDARLLAPFRRVYEVLLKPVDLSFAHRVHARCSVRGERSVRRRLNGKAYPLLLKTEQYRRAPVHEIHELRNTFCDRDDRRQRIDGACEALASGMMQLYRQLSAVAVYLPCHLTHRLDVIIVAHGELRISRRSRHVIDPAYARNDKADAPFGSFLVVVRQPLRHLAARFAETELGGSHDYPVFYLHSPNTHR